MTKKLKLWRQNSDIPSHFYEINRSKMTKVEIDILNHIYEMKNVNIMTKDVSDVR